MNFVFSRFLLLAVIAASSLTARADDWPQWLGPQRDGVWRETGIAARFPKGGPQVLWRTPIHGGYSGPAVVKGKVYVTDYVRESGEVANSPGARIKLTGQERVLCLDGVTGQKIWEHAYSRDYRISYPVGPRATPTIADGKLYMLGAEGDLRCLNAETGQLVWSKALQVEYRIESPIWGFCGHPLVDGDKLICLVGGEGSVAVAFDKNSGKELWKSVSASATGYCPPSIITAANVRQLLIWDADKINSLNPETGSVYWTQPLKPSYEMSIMAPQKSGDLLFASAIGDVGAMFKLDATKPGAELVWKGNSKTAVYCANSTPIIDNGVIYGVCCNGGQLRGVDLLTGQRLWESFQPTTGNRRGGHATAFLVKHEDHYFLFNELGDLILAKLSREGYAELDRFHVLEPTNECFGRSVVWAAPAFANRCAFVRNDKEIVCVSLAKD